jgi:hypothetical protein
MKDRLSLLRSAWVEHAPTCNGQTLRPLSAGTLELLLASGNSLFQDEEERPAGEAPAAPKDETTPLFEFVWMHLAPEEEVVAAFEDHGILRRGARLLSLRTDLSEIAAFGEQFGQIRDRIGAALVEVVPEKDDTPGKPAGTPPPPTGSPSIFTPSGDPPPPSGSTSSSGASPSSAASNTCTPPIARPEPRPDGRSTIWETEAPEDDPEATPLP